MSFSALAGIRPRIEKFSFADADKALAKCLENKIRFRAVLVP